MQMLIADDCNIAWDDKVDFFVYGGLIVPESEMRPLAEQMLQLKAAAGIKKERPIKWSNNGWKGEDPLDEKVHASIKNEVLDFVASSNSRIIVCLSPQSFYHRARISNGGIRMGINPETQRRSQQYGLNDVLEKFHYYLEEVNEVGMVLADKFGTAVKAHMDTHCFDIFPTAHHPRIVHSVIQVDNEQSHLHQINDVVLGAIYFSLREMGYNFLPTIRDNFWMETPGDYSSILNRGFNIYPLVAKVAYISAGKANLRDKFLRLVTAV